MKLTAAARKKIPTKDFAGPGRSYPIEDRNHAINAKARARQMYSDNHLTKSEYDRIVNRANKKLER
jgi:hypothetical protein